MKIVKDVISLKFRTTSENGILLHGEGQQGDYISLELRRARLQLSINLGSFHKMYVVLMTLKGVLCSDNVFYSVEVLAII